LWASALLWVTLRGQGLPALLSLDHDPLFTFQRWQANLRLLEIEAIQTVPYAPVSHPFIECLIGTLRREYLDHCFFWNQHDLEKKLALLQPVAYAPRLGGRHAAGKGGRSKARTCQPSQLHLAVAL
jgi:hypothetical protein